MAEHCEDILRRALSQIAMAEHCQDILRRALSQIEMAEHCQNILRGTVISQIEMSEHPEQGAGSVTNLLASGYVDSGEKRLPSS
jgi:hypothetical protein